MFPFLKKHLHKESYEQILAAPAVHPDRADRARKAIAKGGYEDRGTRDDGVRIFLTETRPPLIVAAKILSVTGGKHSLRMLHVAELRA